MITYEWIVPIAALGYGLAAVVYVHWLERRLAAQRRRR
jgi:hypothetical protein